MLHDPDAHPVPPYFGREYPVCCQNIDVQPHGVLLPASRLEADSPPLPASGFVVDP